MAQRVNDKLLRFLWDGGWCADIGRISVFTDKYSRWRSQWYTSRRYFRWILALLKQATCWHSRWIFNGSGRMEITKQKARECLGHIWADKTGESISAIRHNFQCASCRKFSHRYTPDFERERGGR